MFSISLGFKEDIILKDLVSPLTPETATSPDTTGIPSMTYRGSFPAFMEPVPRKRIESAAPGCPLLLFTVTPGAEPCKTSSNELIGISFNIFFAEIVEAAPVNEAFLAVPYATTITSSSTSASAFKNICKFAFIATS